jgi:hypothetical protein
MTAEQSPLSLLLIALSTACNQLTKRLCETLSHYDAVSALNSETFLEST